GGRQRRGFSRSRSGAGESECASAAGAHCAGWPRAADVMRPASSAGDVVLTPASPGDAAWMQRALELAHAARAVEEVPVGAVIVHAGRILAEAWNLTRTHNDPTAHAEMV